MNRQDLTKELKQIEKIYDNLYDNFGDYILGVDEGLLIDRWIKQSNLALQKLKKVDSKLQSPEVMKLIKLYEQKVIIFEHILSKNKLGALTKEMVQIENEIIKEQEKIGDKRFGIREKLRNICPHCNKRIKE